MKPTVIGSPVYSVYRQASSLKIHWSRIDAVATQSRAAVYWAVAAGPISHSPLPIETPRMIAPAPAIRSAFFGLYGNGAGISATFQGGRVPASTCRSLADTALLAATITLLERS